MKETISYIVKWYDVRRGVEGHNKTRHFDTESSARSFISRLGEDPDEIRNIELIERNIKIEDRKLKIAD